MKILVIEDDQLLAKSMQSALFEHECVLCYNCQQALNEIKNTFDCYLIDIHLPDGNGMDIGSYIRTFSDKPILFISSIHQEEVMIRSYELGGDDYIEKPVRLSVLRMKIKRIEQKLQNQKIYTYKNCHLDSSKQILTQLNKEIELTFLQTVILKTLFKKPEAVISYEYFLRSIQDESGSLLSLETLKVRMSELRKKLKNLPLHIQSVSRIGYRLFSDEI